MLIAFGRSSATTASQKRPVEAGDPEQPEHDAIGGQERADGGAADAARPGLAMRPSPEGDETDGEEAEPEEIGRRHPHRRREAERAQQADHHPAEGEVADEGGEPGLPVAGCLRRHRDDAVAVGLLQPAPARDEQDAPEDEGEAHDQNGHQDAEHEHAQHRRPVEQQEGADAADAEDRHQGEAVGEPHADHAQALRHGGEGMSADPGAGAARRPPERVLRAHAEDDEGGDQDEEAGEAAAGEVLLQHRPGLGDFRRQARYGGGDPLQMRAHPRQLQGKRHRGFALDTRGGGRFGCARRLAADAVEPGAHRRVVEQADEFVDLGRRRRGLLLGKRNAERGQDEEGEAEAAGRRRAHPGDGGADECEEALHLRALPCR